MLLVVVAVVVVVGSFGSSSTSRSSSSSSGSFPSKVVMNGLEQRLFVFDWRGKRGHDDLVRILVMTG